MVRHLLFGKLFPLVLALVAAASTDALAQRWRGLTEPENRIVFSGSRLEDYRALHHHRPSGESGRSAEIYRAQWRAGSRRLPVFEIELYLLAPGYHYSAGRPFSLDRYAKTLTLLKDKAFSTVASGTTGSALGPAEFLIFTADKHRCAVFVLHFDDGSISDSDTLGNTRVNGFYCPVSAQVDAAGLESLLSGVGVRGIAVPEVEEPQAAGRPAPERPSADALATLVTTGDMKGLRRVAVKNFDPNAVIPFQHPRFARGRVIRRPIIMAASLFGQTEMVVFLLKKGASTRGPSAGAICAAIARKHREIVLALVKKDPELKNYNRCGASRDVSALALARRLNLPYIVHELLETNSR